MKCHGKNNIEHIFHHKVAKGRGNNQYSNFKSNVLAGQIKYTLGTFVLRQGRSFVNVSKISITQLTLIQLLNT